MPYRRACLISGVALAVPHCIHDFAFISEIMLENLNAEMEVDGNLNAGMEMDDMQDFDSVGKLHIKSKRERMDRPMYGPMESFYSMYPSAPENSLPDIQSLCGFGLGLEAHF